MTPATNASLENWRHKRSDALICAGLAALTWIVFAQVRHHDFVTWDDTDYVTNNPHVQKGLTDETLHTAFTTNFMGNWHPLTMLSLMAGREWHGPGAAGFLVTNVFLHIIDSLLLFAFLRRATGCRWPSALVAALFAVHPMHVESVAWVSSRKDVLSTFFMLLALLAYQAYAEAERRRIEPHPGPDPEREHRGPVLYALLLGSFAAGLLSKAMVVTLPMLLLLLDYWPLGRFAPAGGRTSGRRACELLVEKIPLLLLACAGAAVALITQTDAGTVQSGEKFPLGVRVENAVVAYATYLVKLTLPMGLSPYYPHPGAQIPLAHIAAAGGVLLALTLVSVRSRRELPFAAVGWAWFVVTLLPVIGIIQIGTQALADRYSYIPSVGWFVAMAWSLRAIAARRPGARLPLALGSALAVLLYASAAWTQASYWKNSMTLYERALAVNERNPVMRNNLGFYFYFRGDLDRAAEQFAATLSRDPGNTRALVGLGQLLVDRGRLDEAEGLLIRSREIDPGDADIHYNLGRLLSLRGDDRAAAYAYRDALRREWSNSKTHNNLGAALARQGEVDRSILHFKESLRISPQNAHAHVNLASALMLRGERAGALHHIEKALEIEPRMPAAQKVLAAMGADR